MWRSLLLKLGMIAVTVGALAWIGWPMAEVPPPSLSQEEAGPPATLDTPQPVRSNTADKTLVQLPTQRRESRTAAPAYAKKVDLNRATIQELQELPGVGPVLARRLVAHRQQGGFKTVEDLMEVKGIGKKRFEQLRPLVGVGAGPTRRAGAMPATAAAERHDE